MSLILRSIGSILAPLVLASSLGAAIAPVFSEDFSDYSGTSASLDFYQKWTRLSGSGNLANDAFHAENPGDAKFPNAAWLQVQRNTVHQQTLTTAVTGDFTLSAVVSFSEYATGKQLWFGLFDSSGTHGYVAHFNSQTSGGGVLRLREFNVSSTGNLTYDLVGSNLTASASASGLASAVDNAAKLTLSWNASTQKLSLLINDTPVSGLTGISVSASAITSFSNIAFGGTSGAQFSDIRLSGTTNIPEPAGVAILISGSILLTGLFIRRRCLTA